MADFIALPLNERVLRKNSENDTWENNEKGHLLCVYQTKETNGAGKKYHARSFEDAFLHINADFIKSKVLDASENLKKDHPFPIYGLLAYCKTNFQFINCSQQ
ncbi:MAG: hypothetical protein H6937_02640 [Burkholderiales bacterium]|nr:hypothetical protein [Burkholderiales bacterium]